MKAGTLTEKIVIQQPVKEKSEFGSVNIVYKDVITTRAQVTFQNMNRVDQNNEIFMPNTTTFTVRRYHNIKNDYIIVWQDRKYRITSINLNKHKQLIDIIGEFINE